MMHKIIEYFEFAAIFLLNAGVWHLSNLVVCQQYSLLCETVW